MLLSKPIVSIFGLQVKSNHSIWVISCSKKEYRLLIYDFLSNKPLARTQNDVYMKYKTLWLRIQTTVSIFRIIFEYMKIEGVGELKIKKTKAPVSQGYSPKKRLISLETGVW